MIVRRVRRKANGLARVLQQLLAEGLAVLVQRMALRAGGRELNLDFNPRRSPSDHAGPQRSESLRTKEPVLRRITALAAMLRILPIQPATRQHQSFPPQQEATIDGRTECLLAAADEHGVWPATFAIPSEAVPNGRPRSARSPRPGRLRWPQGRPSGTTCPRSLPRRSACRRT